MFNSANSWPSGITVACDGCRVSDWGSLPGSTSGKKSRPATTMRGQNISGAIGAGHFRRCDEVAWEVLRSLYIHIEHVCAVRNLTNSLVYIPPVQHLRAAQLAAVLTIFLWIQIFHGFWGHAVSGICGQRTNSRRHAKFMNMVHPSVRKRGCLCCYFCMYNSKLNDLVQKQLLQHHAVPGS